MMPFARNASTRFISPTKTPEFLAAGRPVVSTSIPDVVKPYGEARVVRIGDDVTAFARELERAMADAHDQAWRRRVDELLAGNSWNLTWMRMHELESALYPAREHFPYPEVERWQASPPL